MRRVDRLRKEVRDGVGLQKMAELLYAMAHDETLEVRDRVAAAREWRQIAKDLGRPSGEGSLKDDLAARREARRRA